MTMRKDVWPEVIAMALEYYDPNQRAGVIQSAIQEYGPVPDRHAAKVRDVLKSQQPRSWKYEPSGTNL